MPAVSSCPPDHYVVPPAIHCRDEILALYGEAPASQALQRNREVESWIATIEMLTVPAIDEAFIRAKGKITWLCAEVLLGLHLKTLQRGMGLRPSYGLRFEGFTVERFFEMLLSSNRDVSSASRS